MVGDPTADQLNGVKQDTVQWDAIAHRVILVNSAGDVVKATQLEENRAGSDCSGSDGATGRVLTLTNTAETGNPVAVWVEDQLIAIADYTVAHNAASSTITFDNIEVFDTDTIRVRYYV